MTVCFDRHRDSRSSGSEDFRLIGNLGGVVTTSSRNVIDWPHGISKARTPAVSPVCIWATGALRLAPDESIGAESRTYGEHSFRLLENFLEQRVRSEVAAADR